MLSVLLAILLFYAYRRMGYSVFKLVAWIHPMMVIAFAAAVFALADTLSKLRWRSLRWVALVALPLYVVPNLALAWKMGSTTAFPLTGMLIHNSPEMSFREMRELQRAGRSWAFGSVIATLPDSVVDGWAKAFLLGTGVSFFPMTYFEVIDSQPRSETPLPASRFLLHWNRPELDIVPLPKCSAIWANRSFALSRLEECPNTLVVGQGWYRVEHHGSDALRLSQLRWLRKRGELLVINPSPKPQRLRIGVVVGPGNGSPSRKVSLFLNGKPIEQFTVSGAAQVMTKPFVAPGPSSQLELSIEEDAAPQPRIGALWSLWVPADARRLNLGLSSAELVEADSGPGAIGASFDVGPPNGDWRLFNGVFLDGWIGSEASVSLVPPAAGAVELTVVGMAPGGVGLPFPLQITPVFDGVPLPPCAIERAGSFRANCVVPDSIRRNMRPGQIVQIDIRSEKTFSANGDPRQLSLRIEHVALSLAPGS
jgi:hypothetical protein